MLVRVQRLVTPLVVDIPHANRFVVAGADHVLAARMEHDAAHPVVVAVEREQAHADADVPNLRMDGSLCHPLMCVLSMCRLSSTYADRFVARPGRQERPKMGALLVVGASCLVDGDCRRFGSPGYALDGVLVVA